MELCSADQDDQDDEDGKSQKKDTLNPRGGNWQRENLNS